MRHASLTPLVLTVVFGCASTGPTQGSVVVPNEVEYSRPTYRFLARVPSDWRLHGEREEAGQLLLSFALPRIWSEVEGQEIENDVSVTAYLRAEIESLEEMVAYELARHGAHLISSEETDAPFGKGFVIHSTFDGLRYKSMEVIHFEHGYGYVVSFTATKGTYDKNLPRFRAFCDRLVLNVGAASGG